jgi:site-specific DNA-methyltransferase (adenine-specific)
MDGKLADMFLTDPPYGVSVVGATEDRLTIENDDLAPERFLPFLTNAFRAADDAMRPGASWCIWHGDRHGELFRAAATAAGWDVRFDLVWIKGSMVLGRQDYQWRHELCLYGWKPGGERVWLADGPRSSVLKFAKPGRNAEHPTMKPVELFVCQMANSCPEGGLVLDLFGGSGTAVIAAEKTGRRVCAMELDPKYCDVIRKRWAEYAHGAGCDWEGLTPAVARLAEADVQGEAVDMDFGPAPWRMEEGGDL